MNAGFSSLTALKKQLMPPAMRARTDFDDQLVTLGLGVALLMQSYCDRRFMRAVDDVFRISANNTLVSLPRYPVEEVASVTLQGDVAELITDDVRRIDLASGLLHFDSPPGSQHDTLVIAYTGGFWWDTTEDASGDPPDGATALPEDITTAFFMQCKCVVEEQGTLGTGAADAKDKAARTGDIELLSAVKTILNPHRRFA